VTCSKWFDGSTLVMHPGFGYHPDYPGSWSRDMIRVSSTEFGKELGRYQDAALSQPWSSHAMGATGP